MKIISKKEFKMDDKTIKDAVKEKYRGVALTKSGCCGSGSSCCSDIDLDMSQLIDYDAGGIKPVEGSDLGLGCGMPTQFAQILPGQTILDLGSGAGIDVFLAAQKVGPDGLAIGVDMTEEMIQRARANAEKAGITNVEFRLGEIENLPVDDDSIDLILSNCVINLAPDKRRVLKEMQRVLKPGGKFCISDVVTFGKVPEAIRQDMNLWAGCVAGAMDKTEFLELVRDCGFDDLIIHNFKIYDATKHEEYGTGSLTLEGVKQ
jgi:SAM-dependent methyltransferase